LNIGAQDKALLHLTLAVNMDHSLFREFEDLFPRKLFTRKIKKLLEGNKLI
jgi:hypothetical protein